MKKYRKKPIVIEAIQWDGQEHAFFKDIKHAIYLENEARPTLAIETLEGDMWADVGDWIIKGIDGEFYPVKDSIFKKTYEEI